MSTRISGNVDGALAVASATASARQGDSSPDAAAASAATAAAPAEEIDVSGPPPVAPSAAFEASLLDPMNAITGAEAPTLRQWLTRSVAVVGNMTNPMVLRLLLARVALAPTANAAVVAAQEMLAVRWGAVPLGTRI